MPTPLTGGYPLDDEGIANIRRDYSSPLPSGTELQSRADIRDLLATIDTLKAERDREKARPKGAAWQVKRDLRGCASALASIVYKLGGDPWGNPGNQYLINNAPDMVEALKQRADKLAVLPVVEDRR